MLSIKVDERKPFDISLRNFKRACEKAGIKQELRDRQHYVKPTEKRKIAKRQAVKRVRISQRRAFI
ncbi:30S ribosomal protein S21 [Francisella tularensis]|uniref:30S ribosomal protein S21 n=1 Tax=Francisella tularensis TaxID=263 RepID=UPI0000F5942F|nr:30S ribosomal protein S21 [Francisella tularensis]ABO47375.1 ribosomal protein S21 [Francisella tularensis subsp. tularensis WY96-3418]AJI63896.1 ribosomal protein S21 [Francisella tularensis subsp. tularensis]AKH92531.1 30S ribosomal protein S21 [Francisella tularensis subsp. tularensis WY-00W4114]AKU73292.1 ribosomal protein S21 [Francisella tularensis subsp. tularensis]EKM85270.1 30S ribosomal protein S21 [Francisella tularensis subsp. tularensis 831]